MKYIIAFIAIYCSGIAFAQTHIDPKVYNAAIVAELSKSAHGRYLYDHADAYARLVQYRALKNIGIDISKEPTIDPLTQDIDTGSAIDATKNPIDQNETSIAINKLNENLIVTGLNDMRMFTSGEFAYVSTNQGKGWAARIIPFPKAPFTTPDGDPVVVCDDSGYFYYAYIASTPLGDNNNLIVATSKDGKAWKNGNFVVSLADTSGFEDKEQMTVDNSPSSPFYHRLYIVWMHFADLTDPSVPGGGIHLCYSDDQGKTWSKQIHVGDDGNMQFSEIRTGKNGEVFIGYSIPQVGGGGTHVFFASTDGGNTFSQTTFASYADYPMNSWGRLALKGELGFRCFPYISSDVDLKTNQIHLVYGTWDQGNESGDSASVLYYVTSHDLGKSWSNPKPIGIANPDHSSLAYDRFCPWVSVNQKTGAAYVVYYSSEDDTDNNILVSLYRTKLSEGMADYPREIGDKDFDATMITGNNPGVPAFIGDYIGSDSYDSVYAAAWDESRTNTSEEGDIYVYVSTPKQAPLKSVPILISSKNLWLSAPNPNPISGDIVSFSYYLPQSAVMNIELFSSQGVKVRTLASTYTEEGTYTNDYSLASLASGEYILRLETSYGSVEKKVVIAR